MRRTLPPKMTGAGSWKCWTFFRVELPAFEERYMRVTGEVRLGHMETARGLEDRKLQIDACVDALFSFAQSKDQFLNLDGNVFVEPLSKGFQANYDFTLQYEPNHRKHAFEIAPKTVALTWTDTSVTYNGQAQAPGATAVGLIPGDECAVTVQEVGPNAGSYTARAIALSNGNYALPEDATQAFVIAPKTVGLKWGKTVLTYNGKAQKPVATVTGVIDGDKCKAAVAGAKKNAGRYKAWVTRLSNPNYALPVNRIRTERSSISS